MPDSRQGDDTGKVRSGFSIWELQCIYHHIHDLRLKKEAEARRFPGYAADARELNDMEEAIQRERAALGHIHSLTPDESHQHPGGGER